MSSDRSLNTYFDAPLLNGSNVQIKRMSLFNKKTQKKRKKVKNLEKNILFDKFEKSYKIILFLSLS